MHLAARPSLHLHAVFDEGVPARKILLHDDLVGQFLLSQPRQSQQQVQRANEAGAEVIVAFVDVSHEVVGDQLLYVRRNHAEVERQDLCGLTVGIAADLPCLRVEESPVESILDFAGKLRVVRGISVLAENRRRPAQDGGVEVIAAG